MSIGKAFKIGGVICLVCLIVLIFCVVQVVRGTSAMEEFAQKRFDSILLAQEVRATSSGLTANARAYVSTGDKNYEDAYWALVKIRAGEMARPKEATVAPGQTVPMSKLLVDAGFTREELSLLEESIKISSALVLIEDRAMHAVKGLYPDSRGAFTVQGEPDSTLARELMFGKDYDATVEKIMVPSYKFEKMLNERISAQSIDVKFGLDAALIALFTSVCIFAVVSLGGVLLVLQRIIAPVIASASYAQTVADGDFDAPVPAFSFSANNEIGRMIGSMQRMVENLKDRIQLAEQKSLEAEEQGVKAAAATREALKAQKETEEKQKMILDTAAGVEQVVDRLSSATGQLTVQVEESSRSVDEQQRKVELALAALGEMNSTVSEVARNAGTASMSSFSSKEQAQEGATIVRQSSAALSLVRSDTETLNEQMIQLGKQAEAIGSIIVVINDIADQTNLLALNAAIEAARAGDAGRGFAVVADEVRKLAEKTMLATKEVNDTVKGIQNGTAQNMTTMQNTKENVIKAGGLAEESGKSILGIVSVAEDTAEQIHAIATAAEEQSATCHEITRSLGDITSSASETALAMRHSSQAVLELSSQIQQLQGLVRQLRS